MAALTLTSTVKLSTGYLMPRLGFGVYQNNDCVAACVAAFKKGYRHIDTAQGYKNEEQVGIALRESGLKREDVFIATKCGSDTGAYQATLDAVDASLKKLGLDYIDLFLVHDPLSGPERRIENWKALVEAKKAGKIRTIGVSNFGVRHLQELEKAGLEKPSVNQMQLHPEFQQREIVDYCKKSSIVLVAYCPLAQGKFDIPTLHSVAEKHNKEPAQVLIRWSLQKGFTPIPKSNTPSRISSNAEVYDFELDEEDVAALDALEKGKEGSVTWDVADAP
ncbi:hypothetical protein BOTBODRAFT_132310 [Botryobasidium botryosum FD-172 SS1]|uniref:NADP-dependent oxidoreductase domain-containing protein n=1 Tax=Botryobasidium botryosum (strain FD-172 SS1) TaxID=930990 RepID=A0A067MID6_BOTB1|nr:hypothetical protein BOTBODRAFT_132310 [Botryobasidium botryosum FD-172 SS1]